MKTLKEHMQSSQLVKNVVRSEIERGNPVFLFKNQRTGKSLLKSDVGVICGDEGGLYEDNYSGPYDQISSPEEMADMPFRKIQ